MLRVSPLVLASLVAAFPLAAQANPFKVRTASRPVAVTYQITGDMTGTADYAASGDKLMTHSTSTGKFFGRTATMDNWTLMTPEEVYHADLAKKRGTKTPNMLPEMAREYDRLSGTDKTRLHQNMSDMAAVLAQAFGATSLGAPENLGSATYAGERCDQRKMGGFTTCVLPYAPQVSLHTSGSLMCVDYDQTATAVRHDVPASAFDPPAGITFAEDQAMAQNSDSMARSFVRYLASQQLADSLAKAKSEMAERHAASGKSDQAMPQMDRATCEKLKNLDLGKMMNDAMKDVVANAVKEGVNEKSEEVKQQAKDKIKGLIKKPKLF